jgi:hypothetical protein
MYLWFVPMVQVKLQMVSICKIILHVIAKKRRTWKNIAACLFNALCNNLFTFQRIIRDWLQSFLTHLNILFSISLQNIFNLSWKISVEHVTGYFCQPNKWFLYDVLKIILQMETILSFTCTIGTNHRYMVFRPLSIKINSNSPVVRYYSD